MAEKLFMTDLDRTALGGGFLPYDRFPDHYSDFLDELAADGWDWAINTTWDPEGQWALIQRSKVKSRPRFLIAEFGRQLVEVQNGQPVRINPYTAEMNERIAEYCRKHLLPLLHKLFLRIPPKNVMYYEHLVTIKFRETISMELLPELQEVRNSGIFAMHMEEHVLSLRAVFLSKGMPMPVLIRDFGYKPENIVCAGDEVTDFGMMNPAYSRIFLAPGNASEDVKKHVTDHGGYVGSEKFASGIIDAFRQWQRQCPAESHRSHRSASES